jgi:hypothetical protein
MDIRSIRFFIVAIARVGDSIVRSISLSSIPRIFREITDEPGSQGASSGGDNKEEQDEPMSDENINYYTFQNIDTEVTIDPGEHVYWELDFSDPEPGESRPIMISDVIVREGPKIDIFVLKEDEFEAFENGQRFEGFNDTGVTNSTESATLQLAQYYFVIDNTVSGPTSPENKTQSTATVSIEVTFEPS